MSGRRRRSGSAFGLLTGLALLVAHGCASSSSGGSGGGSGGSGGGSGGSKGSGGTTGSNSGGSSGSGGEQGSGGSTSAGSGGAHGSGGATGTGGASSSGSGGTSAPSCYLGIQPVSPTSWDDLEAGPDATVTVRGIANEFPVMPLTWSWQVNASNGMSIHPTALDGTNTIVQFPVQAAASYQVVAQVSGDRNCQPATQIVMASVSQGPSFTFRTTADGFPIQQTRVKLSDGPSGAFPLDPGQSFTIEPSTPTQGTLLGTYVRISSSDATFDIEGDTTHAPMTALLLTNQMYGLLIVPTDPTAAYAPKSMLSLPGDWTSQFLTIDQGTLVSGQTLDANGMPLANARMQLRQGTVPSTIGSSDATGALSLWTRDGSMSAIVVPPDGSGLPVATTTGADIVSANGASLSLTMRWGTMAKSTLTVQVRDVDGTSPVANAQVRLSSAGVPYSAGTLTAQSPNADAVMLDTTASVTDNLTTGDDGSVAFPPFPAGVYAVTVIPPAGSAPAATTTASVTLTAGSSTQTITLARKVPLDGTLLPLAGAKGAVVTALDVGDLCTGTKSCASSAPSAGGSASTGAVVSGAANDDGTFSLSVDPDRTYQLIVQPAAGGAVTLGRAVLPPFRVCSTVTGPCVTTNDGAIGTITLPTGLTYHGSLSSKNAAVGGAFVQVFCVSSSTCVDSTVSLAEATSLGDGTFSFVLPTTTAQISPPVSN